ncbi:hypothetical protein EON81_04855 [bacterium]|nr:MAG: hypothetical protein EON81_04855 [bacterium]
MKKILFLWPLLAVGMVGCAEPDEVSEGVEPKPPVFEGKAEAKFVAKWKLKGKNSTYDMRADGSYSFAGKVGTPGGEFDNKFEAQWRVNGDKFLMKDRSGNVVAYNYKLEGNTLTLLSVGSLKHETVLIKS